MSENAEKNKYVEAYHHLMDTLKDRWDKTEPTLEEKLDHAREKLSEWGELSREEIEHVVDYVKKDLQAAGDYLERSGKQYGDWLRADLTVAEARLAQMFASVADNTKLELARLQLQASAFGEWHTGETTGAGILECKQCGEQIHFEQPGHIPPCPKCHGSKYRKVFTET